MIRPSRSLTFQGILRGSGFLLLLALLFFPNVLNALQPEEILVLANPRSTASLNLARYYMEKRGIPEAHLVRVKVDTDEQCSRKDYEKGILGPVRLFLQEHDRGQQIRCLVALYGVPMKVGPEELTREERARLAEEEKRIQEAREEWKKAEWEHRDEAAVQDIKKRIEAITKEIGRIRKESQLASVDSELTLARVEGHKLDGWLPNPYFVGYREESLQRLRPQVLMVSRIDGPDERTVRRIIDDSLETEKIGLSGVAYFDARYREEGKPGFTYEGYDLSIRKTAGLVEKDGRMKAVLNTEARLFQPGECPNAALYCGWYSLSKYVDAFEWRKGAVGYHIASGECGTLKRKESEQWCIKMLEKGVAATLGPVAEPYLQAFPPPEIFFGLLLEGNRSLVECYFLSSPFLSWRMVLIGDPLYRPFRNAARPNSKDPPHGSSIHGPGYERTGNRLGP